MMNKKLKRFILFVLFLVYLCVLLFIALPLIYFWLNREFDIFDLFIVLLGFGVYLINVFIEKLHNINKD